VEDATIHEAIVRSLNNLIPADNALPMDAALAWSRQEWEREEVEQHRRLLEEAAARRRAKPAPLIELEDSSDDEWYRPSPSPFGSPRPEQQLAGATRR
jgi:hypothetical protein